MQKLNVLGNYVIITSISGEIEVIITASDNDRIVIAMYVYILHSDVHFDLYYTIRLYTSQCFVSLLPC